MRLGPRATGRGDSRRAGHCGRRSPGQELLALSPLYHVRGVEVPPRPLSRKGPRTRTRTGRSVPLRELHKNRLAQFLGTEDKAESASRGQREAPRVAVAAAEAVAEAAPAALQDWLLVLSFC